MAMYIRAKATLKASATPLKMIGKKSGIIRLQCE
jgi:hypothetical protein